MINTMQDAEKPLPQILNISKSAQTSSPVLFTRAMKKQMKTEPSKHSHQIFTYAKVPIKHKAFKLMPNKQEEYVKKKGKSAKIY